ncbi:M23 family peptidase [Bacillus clarus]|uniref:M23 family peptidase n=1 Tax=Bacillus clarus TaxID=2338372 RepID=A0A090YN14_9BACI|nr:M23 family metallopeptidase [Bacillus clarus]KFM99591.1 peptidase M23 family protein [Bacillus clarus]RFT64997.1 M23 family peptidase [Bacillus clarus]
MAGQVDTYKEDPISFNICPTCPLVSTPFYSYPGFPLSGRITAIKGCGSTHSGALDLTVPNIKIGTPVYAAESGYINVLSYGHESCGCSNVCNYGNFVSIRSNNDHFITQYVHVTPLPGLKLKDQVSVGQQIGTVDISGSSCSPHVHMARYNSSGSPTCDWQLGVTAHTVPSHSHSYPYFHHTHPSVPVDPGVSAHPYMHSPGVYHPSVPPIPRSCLYYW